MTDRLFRYNEPRYYGFGLRLGLTNLVRNGFNLGLRKTVGLVMQPITSHGRLAEYHFLCETLSEAIERSGGAKKVRVLDVGSPKCFGLYLAYYFPVETHLTDLYEPAFRQADQLWTGVKHKARGQVEFCQQDARGLSYPDNSFDIVFSMSVVEHIEGSEGDTQAIREMARVLRPGGILAVSVPFGQVYQEQEIIGFQGAARKTKDGKRYFFQRIYSPEAVEGRILQASPDLQLQSAVSLSRNTRLAWYLHGRFGILPALFGFLYPLWSVVTNSAREGLTPATGRYGALNTARDIYGDAVLVCQKPAGNKNNGDRPDAHSGAVQGTWNRADS